MMIWFAGILLINTCCNSDNKNKTKKHWVVSVMSFNTIMRVEWNFKSVTSMCSTTVIFHFRYWCFEIIYFSGFWLHSNFFLHWIETQRTLSGSHTAIFSSFPLFLDAFLKKRMALLFWKSQVMCWIFVGAHPI